MKAEVMNQIVAKTDGNPLFVEELTKAVLEGDILVKDADGYRLDGPLPPLAIPATLQDSLMARLQINDTGPIRAPAFKRLTGRTDPQFQCISSTRAIAGRYEPVAALERAERGVEVLLLPWEVSPVF